MESNQIDVVEMGKLDEDDPRYLITDMETGEVYDMRNDAEIEHLTSHTILSDQICQINPRSDWSQWWQEKKKYNTMLLTASKKNDMNATRQSLDVELLKDLAAEAERAVGARGTSEETSVWPRHRRPSKPNSQTLVNSCTAGSGRGF